MHRTMIARLGLAALVFSAAGSASAFIWTFDDPMDGLQEVPPNASPATGRVFGTYDDVTKVLHVETLASGFLGPVIAAHLHAPAPPGSNAGVVFPLSGATGGTTYSSSDDFVLNATQEGWLMSGLFYANIHTQVFPGGEIRGQIHLVPEPATVLGLAVGLFAISRTRRRR